MTREQIIEMIQNHSESCTLSRADGLMIHEFADAILALDENDCTCGGYPDCICDITRSAIKQKNNLKGDYGHESSITSFDTKYLESKTAIKTKEEILRKVCKYTDIDTMEFDDDITVSEALEAMEEYRQQPGVTDEEIEKAAQELYESGMALEDESPVNNSWKSVMLHMTQGYRAGARAYGLIPKR